MNLVNVFCFTIALKRLIETRVVFEFSQFPVKTPVRNGLIETRVVFE